MHAGTARKHSATRRLAVAATIVAVAGFGLASCSGDDGAIATTTSSIGDSTSVMPSTTLPPTSSLETSVVDGLIFMREEEKLARDVYEFLGAKWNLAIFGSIAASEQTHTDSIATLLTRYGIPDPAVNTARGEFTIPALQTLYDQLVVLGSRSVVDALTVGAMIEDLDIVDLQNRATSVPDIQAVYENLEKGSRNHLRSFVAQLAQNGATYTPQYLTQAEFDEIVSSPVERGNTN
jgi:hypothetical protein